MAKLSVIPGVIALAITLVACSSSAPLTLRGSTQCPPGAGSIDTWCDDLGNCEYRVTTGGVFRCGAGDTAGCSRALTDATTACQTGRIPSDPDAGPPVPSACVSEVPCVDDGQCAAVAGTSCNTITNRCQTVLCGTEGVACSTGNHCATGLTCVGARCVVGRTGCRSDDPEVCVLTDDDEVCSSGGTFTFGICPSNEVGTCVIESGTMLLYGSETDAAELCAILGGTYQPR